MHPPSHSAPSCPRCGYDQSGIVATWENAGACPVEGTCSECGLAFLWMDVLVPDRTVPDWSFEHAIARRPSRLIATLAMLFRPWRFWRDLRMAHPIRWGRLCLVMLAAAAIAHALASAHGMWLGHDIVLFGATYTPFGTPNSAPPLSYSIGTWLEPDVLWWGAFPFSVQGMGFVLGNVAGVILFQLLAMAALLWLLSDTRRMAKVRNVHIARATVYSLPAAVLTIACGSAALWFYAWGGPIPGADAHGWFLLALLLAYTGWSAAFWWFAIRRYMKLPAAWLVAILTYAVAWFGALVLCFAANIFFLSSL